MSINISQEIALASVQLKRVLRDNMYEREVQATSGTLNSLTLHRYKTSRKLFLRKQEKKNKQYHVEILIDNSGSMYDERAREAFAAAHYMCQLLGPLTDLMVTQFNYNELRMPWKLFHKNFINDTSSKSTHNNKNWYISDRKDGNNIYSERDEDGDYQGYYGNWEIIHILRAAERLKKCKGDKFIFILLDGGPNLDQHSKYSRNEKDEMPTERLYINGYCVNEYPRNRYFAIVNELIESGIKVFAFGINTSSPQQYYPVFKKVSSPEDVVPFVVQLLKEYLPK